MDLSPASASKKSRALSLLLVSMALSILYCPDERSLWWETEFQALLDYHSYKSLDHIHEM